ncbi:MAG: M48 family metalloprotease [Proteobacteria bacterium]|nr:M48 family metalloprotease [Pseudomonadota bacterium]
MPKPLRRPVVALVAAVLLLAGTGCTVNPATGEQSFTAFMSAEKEIEVGREERPKILRQFGGEVEDAAIRAYVDEVGQRLAQASDMPGLRFTFTVLNTDIVNAMATPGGYVYVTRGLLALADSEAELAGVLGHEIGHVTARHAAQQYSAAMTLGIGATVLGILVDNRLASDLAQAGSQLFLAAYSRDQEFEADLLGVRHLARAGYDTAAMASMLAKIETHSRLEARIAGREGGPDEYNFLATHPRTPDRVARAVAQAGVVAPPEPRVARTEYLGRIDGLVFGDDPKEGMVRGQAFVHPGLGLRFEAPPGFRLRNAAREVVATHKNGALILFDRPERPVRGGLVAYVGGEWAGGRAREVEAITINGIEAATGWLRLNTRQGPRDVRLVAMRLDAASVYRFFFVTPPGLTAALATEFRRTTYSFRRLSAAEAAAARPLRLRLRAVAPGDTIARFVALMEVGEFKREWFQVLNGLAEGEPLRPGRLVKVVAY